MQHLAAWNAQQTNVGGVLMTNEDAQKARQHIIDNADAYADRAVREGRITDDEREEYKQTIRRIKDLEDKKGRGTISDEERQECERLKRSDAGRAAEADVGQYHKEMAGYGLSADASESRRREPNSVACNADLFQSAPDLGNSFTCAKEATEPPDKKQSPTVAAISPKVAATGLTV